MDFDIPQRRQLQIRSEEVHFTKMVAQLDSHMGKHFPRLLPYNTQIESRFLENLDLKSKTHKPFYDNIGEDICDFRVKRTS